MSFNRVVLLGHLTRDVEIRYTPKGVPVGQSCIATNRKWKTEDGTEHDEVCFAEFVTFGRQAETLAQYVKKGGQVLLEGRLTLDQWEDKQSGQKRQKLKVTVERFSFVGSGGGSRNAADQGESRAEAAQADAPEEESDVPF